MWGKRGSHTLTHTPISLSKYSLLVLLQLYYLQMACFVTHGCAICRYLLPVDNRPGLNWLFCLWSTSSFAGLSLNLVEDYQTACKLKRLIGLVSHFATVFDVSM
ncbi:hypothetical protein FRX31_003969 [Thalictrum thalictroides]|uniref:Uncharacterized protein n=1 Tax=Thalictrum thalictroides TaxID=46969 RepID=A0A7J6XC16_THATH|nr:hypothetical protein FRX31_003969 [Thalictrum thalictroides]